MEQAFQDLLNDQFNDYILLSAQIGDVIKVHSEIVKEAILQEQKLLQLAASCQKPTDAELQKIIKPIADGIQAVQSFREKNRTNVYFNHLSTISESIPALGWVVISPTPAPYVKEMSDAAQFYANKVLVAYKEKDKTHVAWANAWSGFLTGLQKFIRQYHTTGLVWNPRGQPISECALLKNGHAARSGPPPPPLPPPPPAAPLCSASAGDAADDRLALMKELNIGSDITKNLRKVRPDQQTHKNPALRDAPAVVSKVGSGSPASAGRQAAAPVQHPPKFVLEGRKWLIEYQQNQPQLIVNINEMNESVHLYRCKDTVVVLKGKANSVFIDSCVKTGVVFDDIVSSVEFVNCQNIQAQSLGKVPTISVEKTDVAQIYLSNDSLNSEIVTAKSSSVNVNVPDVVNGFVEHAIPEQFKSTWQGKGFRTEPTDIAG